MGDDSSCFSVAEAFDLEVGAWRIILLIAGGIERS